MVWHRLRARCAHSPPQILCEPVAVAAATTWAQLVAASLPHAIAELQGHELPGQVGALSPMRGFTPLEFITLLFTDLGVLTPSAVSDELIKLYY